MASIARKGFLKWALGDLLSNSERGLVAEYLARKATGYLDNGRVEWDAWGLN